MSRNVVQLLRGQLASRGGAWLLAAVITQFSTTSAVWALAWEHELLAGVALVALGAALTMPPQTLAWQVLPISSREMALARWWAIAGVPGVALSVTQLLAALVNHDNAYYAPGVGMIVFQVATLWSMLGVLAWLPSLPRWQRGLRARTVFIAVWGAVAVLAAYGYPLRPRLLVVSAWPVALGLALLFASLRRALKAHPLEREEVPRHDRYRDFDRRITARVTSISRLRGWAQLVWPLLGRTVAMSVVCIGGASVLRWLYPGATDVLIWVFLAAVLLWSGLATRRWLGTLWFWRCLPLSSLRLAIVLQLVALAPGIATFVLAWSIHHLAAAVSLPLPGWLIAAFVTLQSAIDTQLRGARTRQRAGRMNQGWMAQSARLTYPAYITVLLVAMLTRTLVSSLIWLCASWCMAAVLVGTNYYLAVVQLRSADAPEWSAGDRLNWQPRSAFHSRLEIEAETPGFGATAWPRISD